MVRLSHILARVPVIKFRKGKSHGGAAPSAAAPGASALKKPGVCSLPQKQQVQPMSTVPDIDLPQRYRRAPLSQEEIDLVNGGGIV